MIWCVVIFDFPPNSNVMRRQDHIHNLGRVYREFARQRYNKYHSQFPKLKEAEIVARILREWDRMTPEEKLALGAEFVRRNYIKDQPSGGSNSNPSSTFKTPTKTDKYKSLLLTTDKSMLAPSTAKTDDPLKRFLENEDEMPFCPDYLEEPHESRSSYSLIDREQISSFGKEHPGSSRTNYIVFYKAYFKKFSREHPHWGTAKITSLISLLWKRLIKSKKVLKGRKGRESKVSVKVRSIRKMTGYVLFKKSKLRELCSVPEAKSLWRRLPAETKRKWDQEGETGLSQSLFTHCSTVRFGGFCSGNLSFMRKVIPAEQE